MKLPFLALLIVWMLTMMVLLALYTYSNIDPVWFLIGAYLWNRVKEENA